MDSLTPVCVWDLEARTVTLSSAWLLTAEDPELIELTLSPLKNPTVSVETESFALQTWTSDGYDLDLINQNMTVNFACKYPCATCVEGSSSKCLSCYTTISHKYLHSETCYASCPSGMYEDAADNTCKDCNSNCKECSGNADYCTECQLFWVLGDKETISWSEGEEVQS
jgi:hypothetical protein